MIGKTTRYLIAALLFVGLFLSSCQKEYDSIVRVTVVDSDGNPIEGASVNLAGQPSDTIYVNHLTLYDLDEVTDASGIANFSFNDFYDQGDQGFAVLTITVNKDTLTGSGYVKVVEGETNTTTVTVD